jgi:hypothetical protein
LNKTGKINQKESDFMKMNNHSMGRGHLLRTGFCLAAAALLFSGIGCKSVQPLPPTASVKCIKKAENPLLPVPGGDPDANVFEGEVYAYCKRDRRCRPDFNDQSWTAFSSPDLVHWTDHEDIMHMDDVPWGVANAFAPCASYRNGTYYLYAPCCDENDQWGIAVGASPNPEGPFEYKAKIDIKQYDPDVFIDDDGQAYIYFPHLLTRLKDNMLEIEGEIIPKEDYLVGGPLDPEKYNVWENPHVFKKDGKYYYLLSVIDLDEEGNFTFGQKIHYWMGDSPTGPFYYKDMIHDQPRGNCGASIVEFKGDWYFFYHRPLWSEDVKCAERKSCMDPVEFNKDGTIKPVIATLPGMELINEKTFSADSGNWTTEGWIVALRHIHDGDVLTPARARGDEAWVEYTFDKPRTLRRARVHSNGSGDWQIEEWKVSCWVDGAWRDAFDWNEKTSGGWEDEDFDGITTTRVRGWFRPGLEDRIEVQCFQLFERTFEGAGMSGSLADE